MAQKKLFALLVSSRSDSLDDLKVLLKNQSIETWSAHSSEEVEQLLEQTHPELIFTGETLLNGTWVDIVNLSEKSSVPTNVIVVSSSKNVPFYLSAMDLGAFDFILPPFEADPINHVVRVAAENVRRQREEWAAKAAA